MKRSNVFVILFLAGSLYGADPEPPRILINTTYIPSACTTTVASGGNVQTAITNASCGDTICLEATATFTANFTLPDKDCSDTTWVTIRTATTDANFIRPGTRVAPGDAALMSKLAAGSGSIISSSSDADHYRFIGIEFEATAYLNTLIALEGGQGSTSTMTNNIIFDRCYVHGDAVDGSRRGISAQGAYISVIDSYLSDLKEVGADSQAFAAWNGPGPFKLVNNYLSGAGENVMFGGAQSASADMIPSDIEIRRNYFFKPLTWRVGDPSYEGTHWTIKNLLEFKDAQRVIVENNLFEHCWGDAQSGIAILFNITTEAGTSPWQVTNDILIRSNTIDSAAGGIDITGEYFLGSNISERIEISNNLFTDIDCTTWGSCGVPWFQIVTGPIDVTIENNTAFIPTTGVAIASLAGSPDSQGWIHRYNISSHSSYGAYGDGVGVGDDGIAAFSPDAIYTENVMTDQPTYGTFYTAHPGNIFPANMAAVGFVNLGGGDYRLDASSSYDGIGPGGSDYGVFFPSAGQSFLDLDVQAAGTSAILRFGRPGLVSTASCTYRYGASSGVSNSGGSRRSVVITGLTNAQQYAFSIDCGDVDGDIADSLFTATIPTGGDRTVPIQIGAPTTALAALGAVRCTFDYGTTTAVSDGSVQDTSCDSGGSVNLTIPAGVIFWRPRWQTVGDVTLATGTPQPINIP